MVIACLLAVCVGSARADDDKQDGSKAKAGEYFAKGSGLFESGDFARAAASFLLAYELAPHPMVLANIAMSYDKAGNIVKAIEYYEKYSVNIKKKKERRKIKKRLRELSAMVGELSVECPAASCRIEVDKIDRGNAPVRIVVEIGLHRVEAFDGKNKIAAVDARVVSGEVSKVELFQREVIPEEKEKEEEPVEEPIEEVPAEPVPEEEGVTLGAGFWISAGATVAAGAVTVVFGVKALKSKEDFDATGGTDEDLRDQGERDQLITNVMIGVTSAAAACAIGFLIYDLKSGDGEKEEPVAVVPGPGLGLAVVGRF
jgi:hypothetical protein